MDEVITGYAPGSADQSSPLAESIGIVGEGSIFFVELPIETCITEVIKAQEK